MTKFVLRPNTHFYPLQILHVNLHAVNGAYAEDDERQTEHDAPPQTRVAIGRHFVSVFIFVVIVGGR